MFVLDLCPTKSNKVLLLAVQGLLVIGEIKWNASVVEIKVEGYVVKCG